MGNQSDEYLRTEYFANRLIFKNRGAVKYRGLRLVIFMNLCFVCLGLKHCQLYTKPRVPAYSVRLAICAIHPPSMTRAEPVTHDDSSDARYSAA